MKRLPETEIGPGAVLALALACFFDCAGALPAVAAAAAAHEAGHLLALGCLGCRVTRVSVRLTGLELDYVPRADGWRALLCFAAGPLAGLLYAVAAATLGGGFLRVSGGASLLLSVFNLLPILPLDGGRMLAVFIGYEAARRVSFLSSLVLAALGARLFAQGYSPLPLLLAIWLAAGNLRAPKRSVEKTEAAKR